MVRKVSKETITIDLEVLMVLKQIKTDFQFLKVNKYYVETM